MRPRGLEPPRAKRSQGPQPQPGGVRCVRSPQNRPFRTRAQTHLTHLEERLFSRCSHGRRRLATHPTAGVAVAFTREESRRSIGTGCRLSVQGPACQGRDVVVGGGEWLRVVWRFGCSCARAPRLISVLDSWGVGDMMVVGCCSRLGKRCGRSVFGGRPPEGVGSDMPGAGRDVSV
jgi:hypothetical protein